MKRKRQGIIREAVRSEAVKNQQELVELLAERGMKVSQTTVSRDLAELGFRRGRDPEGTVRYLPVSEAEANGKALLEMAPHTLLSAEASGNLVVVKTRPGTSQGLAWALDQAALEGVLGTVAGDDTILIVCEIDAVSAVVADRIIAYGQGKE